jgi:uncharacterized protein (TIGR01777 family)
MAKKRNSNRVLISGASGLVGSHLAQHLTMNGWEVLRLTRRPPDGRQGQEIGWDPSSDQLIEDPRLEGVGAVVHLAGENILGRWTRDKKAAIRASRVQGTQILCRSLARLKKPPATLLSASAVGYYGNTGRSEVSESSPAGTGFLADVCAEWEKATEAAGQAGIRVVHLRIGVVLDRQGGALKQMLPPFRFGLGGPIGNGQQFVSWITIDDMVRAIQFVMDTPRLSGPVNLVSPSPTTNRSFSRALGQVLHRPALIPVPAFVITILFGEMAEDTILSSSRAVPSALLKAGFSFEHNRIEAALAHVLGRNRGRLG